MRVIARNLAVFSNVTLTKNLYGIRKSGHFTYSWYNNYYSRSCVFFIADMLQILAAVKTSRSPCVVKILQYIFFIFSRCCFAWQSEGTPRTEGMGRNMAGGCLQQRKNHKNDIYGKKRADRVMIGTGPCWSQGMQQLQQSATSFRHIWPARACKVCVNLDGLFWRSCCVCTH